MAIAFLTATTVLQAEQCSIGGECPSEGEPQNVLSLLQSEHRVNAPEAKLRPACAERKLVINSHIKYGVALDRLVASLKEYKFPLEDCVVFLGGATMQDVSDHPGPRIGPDGMTFVDLPLDNFDLNAFAGLSRYKNHSLVCANMYFYIHDSTQIGPCFPQVFNEIKVSPTEVITPGTEIFSNQCVFGSSVVDKFGDDFEGHIDKLQGFPIEQGGCSGKACSIAHYAGKQTVIPERRYLGEVDLYGTSKPRMVTWYQEWDLYKFYLRQHPDTGLQTDVSLLQRDYVQAPSCARRCIVKGVRC